MIEIYFSLFVFLSIIIIWIKTSNDRSLFKILFLAFFLRTFLLFIEFYVAPGTPYLSAFDSVRFHEWGIAFAEQGLATLLQPPYPSGSELYGLWVGIVYALLGFESELLARCVNVFVGVLVVSNVYHISSILWGRRLGLQNAFLASVFPLLVIYSQDLLRESFVVYFMLLGIRNYCVWYRYAKIQSLILAIVFILISAAFHIGALLSLVAIAAYNLWLAIKQILRGEIIGVFKSALAILIVGAGLAYANATGWGLSDIGGQGALEQFGVEELIEKRGSGSAAVGRATYLQGLVATTAADVVIQTPIRLIYFVLAPFPWMISSVWDSVGLIDAFFYLLILLGIYKSWPLLKRDPLKIILLLMLLAMAITFAWGVTNYGTGMRHRAKIVGLAICLAPHLWPFRKVYFNRALNRFQIMIRSRRFKH